VPYHTLELTTEFRTSDTRSFSLIAGMGGMQGTSMGGGMQSGGMQSGGMQSGGMQNGNTQSGGMQSGNTQSGGLQRRGALSRGIQSGTQNTNNTEQSWQGTASSGRIAQGLESGLGGGMVNGMMSGMSERPYWEIGAQAREYVAGNFDNGLNLGGQVRFFKTALQPGDNSTPERAAAFGPFLGVKMTLAVFSLEAQAGAQVIYDTQNVMVRPMMNVMAGLSF
jgi:hypothetical protein